MRAKNVAAVLGDYYAIIWFSSPTCQRLKIERINHSEINGKQQGVMLGVYVLLVGGNGPVKCPLFL